MLRGRMEKRIRCGNGGGSSVRGMNEMSLRRRSLLVAAGAVPLATAAGPAVAAGTGNATGAAGQGRVRGGAPLEERIAAYDRYVRELAERGRFSGVVLLAHEGRTVLSRAYGMADESRGIRNSERTRFALSSAGKPFGVIAVLQLAEQGRLKVTDTVGHHLDGFPDDVARQVTIHHLLSGASGTDAPPEDVQRVTHSRREVHDLYAGRARQARLAGIPGLPSETHQEANTTIPALIVEAVSGMPYWDYVEKHIFRRAGMTDSGFVDRPQWIRDRSIAHPYMVLADGTYVDALHHLDKGSPYDYILGKNPGRTFVDAPGDGGFATAPDLVRFVRALHDGTLLSRPWRDVLFAPRTPTGPASFGAYGIGVEIFAGQWTYQRAGGNPGVGANWTVFPGTETGTGTRTDWTGVILINRDAGDLLGMLARETEAITGIRPEHGTGG